MNSVTQELGQPDWNLSVADDWWDETSPVKWFVAMKAFESVKVRVGHDLGEDFEKHEEEFQLLKDEAKLITSRFTDQPVADKFLREILRFGTSKLHNVSAFLGGVAAQEAVKLIMNQYIPLKHTLVYDGIHGKGAVYDL